MSIFTRMDPISLENLLRVEILRLHETVAEQAGTIAVLEAKLRATHSRSVEFPQRQLRFTIVTEDAEQARSLPPGWHESATIGPYTVIIVTTDPLILESPDEKPFREEDR